MMRVAAAFNHAGFTSELDREYRICIFYQRLQKYASDNIRHKNRGTNKIKSILHYNIIVIIVSSIIIKIIQQKQTPAKAIKMKLFNKKRSPSKRNRLNVHAGDDSDDESDGTSLLKSPSSTTHNNNNNFINDFDDDDNHNNNIDLFADFDAFQHQTASSTTDFMLAKSNTAATPVHSNLATTANYDNNDDVFMQTTNTKSTRTAKANATTTMTTTTTSTTGTSTNVNPFEDEEDEEVKDSDNNPFDDDDDDDDDQGDQKNISFVPSTTTSRSTTTNPFVDDEDSVGESKGSSKNPFDDDDDEEEQGQAEEDTTTTNPFGSSTSAAASESTNNKKNPFESNEEEEVEESGHDDNSTTEDNADAVAAIVESLPPSSSPDDAVSLQDIIQRLQDHAKQQELQQKEEHKQRLQQQQKSRDSINPFDDENISSTHTRTSQSTTATSSTIVDLDSILDMYEMKLMSAQIVDCMTTNDDDLLLQVLGCYAFQLLAVQLQRELNDDDNDDDQYDDVRNSNDDNGSQATTNTENDGGMTVHGVEAILTAMEEFASEELLQQHGCFALQSLTVFAENARYVVSSGHVEEVLVAMEGHTRNAPLLIATLTTIENIANYQSSNVTDDPSDMKFQQQEQKQLSHAIPLILEVLKEHKDDADIYVQGCSTLAALTYKNPTNQLLLCKGQIGLRIIIDAVHKFTKQTLQVQLHAIRTLENIASHTSPECKRKIVLVQGGLDRILDALKRNTITTTSISSYEDEIEPDDDQQQQHQKDVSRSIIISALKTLSNMAISDPNVTASSDETKRLMSKAVKVILNVLRQHPHNSSVQVTGFTALRYLSDVHSELITSYGGISTILIAMLEQPTDFAMQEQACETLTNLLSSPNMSADGSLDLIHTIATEDGLTTIFRSVRMHQAHRAVQESAFGALYYLSCSRDLTSSQKQQLCLEENIFVLFGTMNQYIDSEILCHRGCGLILNLSFFAPLSQDVMASVGGIRIILAAMRRHGLNAQIQEYSVAILSGLCLDEKNHQEFVNEEGISSVLAAMMIHPDQSSIQAHCCDLLVHLACSNPEYKQSIIDGNGQMVANDAMIRHKAHKGVQGRGAELLQALS
jgi:hypothetical protein